MQQERCNQSGFLRQGFATAKFLMSLIDKNRCKKDEFSPLEKGLLKGLAFLSSQYEVTRG
jgi:hypothetical protein